MKVKFNEMANGQLANLFCEFGNVKQFYTNEKNEVRVLNIGVPCRVLYNYGQYRVTWSEGVNDFNSNSESSPVYDNLQELVLEWLYPYKSMDITRTQAGF